MYQHYVHSQPNTHNQVLTHHRPRHTCINCGSATHVYRHCQQPVTSFGIVAYRDNPVNGNRMSEGKSEAKSEGKSEGNSNRMSEGLHSPRRRCHRHRRVEDCPDHIDAEASSQHRLLFLMVQRKDTMAYTDLVRGVYPQDPDERDSIVSTFVTELTCEEREKLLMSPFQQIWDGLWMNHSRCHVAEFGAARAKFEQLNIRKLLEEIPCSWSQQEFGFPKGRRNINESNKDCAIREFCEESGYLPSELTIVPGEPFVERFTGTNNKEYRHVYYLAQVNSDATGPRFDPTNVQQAAEIRKVAWLTYEQCLAIMRPYDTAKKETLRRIHDSLKGQCCPRAKSVASEQSNKSISSS